MSDLNDSYRKAVNDRKRQEKQDINESMPIILQMDKILSVQEFCHFVGSRRVRYIIAQLFNHLEHEIKKISSTSDLSYINKLISYIDEFNKNSAISKIYMYRKAKNVLYIIEGIRKPFKKKNEDIYKYLTDIIPTFDGIKSNALVVSKNQYSFMMKFICEIRDIRDIEALISKYPNFVNLKDKNDKPIISNLMEIFIKSVLTKRLSSNIYNLTYYQSVIELFLNSEHLRLDPLYMDMIKERLNEAAKTLQSEKDSKKSLWISSMYSTFFDKASAMTGDEVLNKYNIHFHQPTDAKKNYKLTIDGRFKIEGSKIITIDGQFSKDLDDAITLEKKDNKYHLKVFISDIASFLKRGSALDIIARKRGSSLYLPDREEPMLPRIIAHDFASLNVGSYKNVLCYSLIINQNGEVEDGIDISRASIKVDRRLSFDEVDNILVNGDTDTELEAMLHHMSDLALILRSKSNRINLNFFDDFDRGPNLATRKSSAHKIIDEFMLLINTQSASKVTPWIYRTHKFDKRGELERLRELVLSMAGDNNPEIVNDILKILSSTVDNARYSQVNTGHEALGQDYYGHSSAPVRRYPDIENQRILYDFEFSDPTLTKEKFYDNYLGRLIPELNDTNFVNKRIGREFVAQKYKSIKNG